jgi:hypothetical protein
MNPKPHCSAILFFATILLSCFSLHAQSSADLIGMEKRGTGYIYYQGNKALSFKQVMQLTASHPEASTLMAQANNIRGSAQIFGIVGGGCIGFSLGYLLANAVTGKAINKPVLFISLGAGAVFSGIGIGCDVRANNKTKEAIDVYNQHIKQKNKTNLDLGLSANGAMIRLNF